MRRAMLGAGLAGMIATSMVAATGVGTAGAQSGSSNKLTVTAGEYVYTLAGKPKPGNVEIVFDNQGVEMHMMVLIQLKPNVTKQQLTKAFHSEDDSAIEKLAAGQGFAVSGVPGLASEGITATTITNLKAGHYGIACFVPVEGSPTPHALEGMVGVFDVKGSKSTLKPPTDGVAEITIADSGIQIPAGGLPKAGWAKVTNEASGGRDLTVAKYAAATTFEAANAAVDTFFQTGTYPGGAAPVSMHGGFISLAPGASAYMQLDLDAGNWVLVSGDDEGENDLHLDFSVS